MYVNFHHTDWIVKEIVIIETTNYGQPGSCDFTINTIEEYFASEGDYLEISEF